MQRSALGPCASPPSGEDGRVGEAYGGRPGQHVEGWSDGAAHGNAARHMGDGLNADGGGGGSKDRNTTPHNHQHSPQCTNYWAPLTRKRHQQEHRPQRPTERSDPTQHAKGRTGD